MLYMSFIHKKVKVLLCHLGVWLVCSFSWPLLVFHLDKPFLKGRWWQISCWIILFPTLLFNVPTRLYITQWHKTSCQSSVFSKERFPPTRRATVLEKIDWAALTVKRESKSLSTSFIKKKTRQFCCFTSL